MKEVNCTKENAFKAILKASESLNWSIIEVDEPSKVTVESPKTWNYYGQRYVISIIGDSPCSLNYSVHGKKFGLITQIPNQKYAEKDMLQLFTLLDAELEDTSDNSVTEGMTQTQSTDNTEEPQPVEESQDSQEKTESKKEAAMREIQEQQQADKKKKSTIAAAVIIIGLVGFAIFQSSGSSAIGVHIVGSGFDRGDFIEIKPGGKALFYQADEVNMKPRSGAAKSCSATGRWEKTSDGGIRVSGLSNGNCDFIRRYNKTYYW